MNANQNFFCLQENQIFNIFTIMFFLNKIIRALSNIFNQLI